MQKKKNDIFNTGRDIPSRLYVLLGIIFLAAHIAVCAYTTIPPTWSGLVTVLLYSLVCFIIFIIGSRRMSIYKTESEASDNQSGSVIAAFRDNVKIPYAIVTDTGKIVTVNAAMRDAIPRRESFLNSNISDALGVSLDSILRMTSNQHSEHVASADTFSLKTNTVRIAGKNYTVSAYPIKFKGHIYYMVLFEDITELYEIAESNFAQIPVVAYITLDNLEEIAQYVKASYRAEANQVEQVLKEFAASIGGLIREYDRDKYMLIISRQALAVCEKNKFEILDTIRSIRIGEEEMPLTVSIGIASTGETLAERERDALLALDTALQRGGDQVVLKKESGLLFFGGKTKSQQKRTKGHSRIIANKLCAMIQSSYNVIIMGHANPDFDSIGACIGLANLSSQLGIDAKIVVDTSSASFKNCTRKLIELDEYRNMFVDSTEALELYDFNSLVIVVDVNDLSITESPELAEKTFRMAVIDHHIKKNEFEREPALTYIDPSASSACELITEIIEQSLPASTLKKEEANVMISGIMLDTQNFTRTVGPRTFAAALYLRNAGASPEIARTFFEEEFDAYRSEALFGASLEVHRDRIAITASEGTGSSQDRIAAAKAANKLLTVRNISAAFALVKIGERIHVSARSDGSVNVQLILEKIGGGGHFDMAGAALDGTSLEKAKEILLGAINEYLDEEEQ